MICTEYTTELFVENTFCYITKKKKKKLNLYNLQKKIFNLTEENRVPDSIYARLFLLLVIRYPDDPQLIA